MDNGGFASALLMDLSKALSCLSEELLLAKLHAYGFKVSTLAFIHSYLRTEDKGSKVKIPLARGKKLI